MKPATTARLIVSICLGGGPWLALCVFWMAVDGRLLRDPGMLRMVGYTAIIVAALTGGVYWGLGFRRKSVFTVETAPGRCKRCGYDLRATPRRCPECGEKA